MVRSWRNSLYARAALFLVLGCGSILGAVVVVSAALVEESVERLLQERLDLAQTTGILFEQWLRSDLNHLSHDVAPLLQQEGAGVEELRAVLGERQPGALFDRGTFALDVHGRVLAQLVAKGGSPLTEEVLDGLVKEVGRQAGPVVSSLRPAEDETPPSLVMLGPVDDGHGMLLGYVGGVLLPARTPVVDALVRGRGGSKIKMDVIDRHGVVVASTHPGELYADSDHSSVLTEAMRTHRPVHGRCHSCHQGDDDAEPRRANEVLAFSSLPTLALGVAVREPEVSALAHAFALRSRIGLLAGVFGSLFLLFAGLSVRSVVRPITRLTRHVRQLEATDIRRDLPVLGHDEVGELASALDRWRGRLVTSLDENEQRRLALHEEVNNARLHLAALQDIAMHGTLGASIHDITRAGLARILAVLGLEAGAISVRHGDEVSSAVHGMTDADAAELLSQGARASGEDAQQAPDAASGPSFRTGFRDLRKVGGVEVRADLHTLAWATLSTAHGISVSCAVGRAAGGRVEERWLISLLHHVGMSAANRLLRDRELERRALHEQYLHRVLTAQEDERRRIARELHDTLAQDLAALRLELERLATREAPPDVTERLKGLEQRAHQILVMVRQILLDLRLTVLDKQALVPTLQAHLERVEKARHIRTVLTVHGEEHELPYDVAVTLFRIFQEALQNVAQHAKAEHVFVTLTFEAGRVVLEVEDDGAGFDVDTRRASKPDRDGRGLGLLGMEERARLLGGQVEVDSQRDEGTTIRVVIPVEAA